MFATTTVLGVMRWPEDAHLLVLGICSFAAASAGRLAWRRQGTWHLPGGWAISHITGMSGSHIVLLTAFYPNNARTRRFGATCHTDPFLSLRHRSRID